MKLEEIVRAGLSRVDTIRVVSTAVNPLLWLVGMTTVSAVVAILFVGDQLVRLALIGFAAVPVLATLVFYAIFMFRDPDRLQSEEYRIQLRELKLRLRQHQRPEIVDITGQKARIERPAPRSDTGDEP
jgi:ABC-type multidrug transport system fused ATPase/permease subunit